MLLSLVIVALAATSVSGQGCIPGAQMNEEGKCKCIDAGDPEMCCYIPATEKSCRVIGDPVLTTFSGQKIGLDFPCGTLVSSTKVPGSCSVDIYTASKHIKYNTYFTSRAKIVLGGGAVDLDISTTNQLVYKGSGSAQPIYLAEGGDRQKLNGNGIGDLYVSLDSFGRITITACGSTIFVRIAVDIDLFQKNPGVCIVTWKESVVASSMCGINGNLKFATNKQYLAFATRPMQEYWNEFGIRRLITSHEAEFCAHFQKSTRISCSASTRQLAFEKCAVIIFQATIRRCMIGELLGHFVHCVVTYCSGRKDLCDVTKNNYLWQSCVPSLTKCDTWPRYREVNKIVAGEGGGDNTQFGSEATNAPAEATTDFSLGEEDILGEKQTTKRPETTEGFDLDGGGFF